MQALYGANKTTTTLNVHRHNQFIKVVAYSAVHNKIHLAALPPISVAARKHPYSITNEIMVRSRAATD